jgi:aspartate aminotransferase
MSSNIHNRQPLLDAQERLDRVIASTFTRFGPRTVDLSYANPHDGPSVEVLSILAHATAASKGLSLQYTPIAGRTAPRRAVAARLMRQLSLPFDYRDIVLTAGAMPALNIVARTLFGARDEVIVLTPCWQDYPVYLSNLNVPFRLVPLGAGKRLDLSAIRDAIGPSTTGVLFSQPCCPTGVMYSPAEIEGLAAIVRDAEARFGNSIYIVSDEVHRDVVWSHRPFRSPLQSYDRSLSIYSFGKAFAIQGQRIGYIALSPRMPQLDEIRVAIERSVRSMGFGHPASVMQRAVSDLVDCQANTTRLAEAQDTVRRALTASGYAVCDGDATFYVYVKSPIADDVQFAERLASRGVLVVPSSVFHDAGHLRLSLTARPERIVAALPVFAAALEEVSSPCFSRC